MNSAIIRPQTCAGCKYMVKPGPLECHRHAPTVVPIFGTGPQGRPVEAGCWTGFPKVQADWSCGEWGPRIVSAGDALAEAVPANARAS